MAIAPRSPAIPRMRAALEDARQRAVPFDQAWRRALAAVRPCSELRAVLAETRETWERAYDGEPASPAEHAAGESIEMLDSLEAEPVAA